MTSQLLLYCTCFCNGYSIICLQYLTNDEIIRICAAVRFRKNLNWGSVVVVMIRDRDVFWMRYGRIVVISTVNRHAWYYSILYIILTTISENVHNGTDHISTTWCNLLLYLSLISRSSVLTASLPQICIKQAVYYNSVVLNLVRQPRKVQSINQSIMQRRIFRSKTKNL